MFEAAERGRQAHYKLTSTIMLQMVDRSASSRSNKEDVVKSKTLSAAPEQNDAKREGEVTLSGSMTRQTEQDFPLQDQTSHITNTGKMIEEMEIKMRNLLQEVCVRPQACTARTNTLLVAASFPCRFTSARLVMLSSTCALWMTWRRPEDSENYRRSWWASSSGDEYCGV